MGNFLGYPLASNTEGISGVSSRRGVSRAHTKRIGSRPSNAPAPDSESRKIHLPSPPHADDNEESNGNRQDDPEDEDTVKRKWFEYITQSTDTNTSSRLVKLDYTKEEVLHHLISKCRPGENAPIKAEIEEHLHSLLWLDKPSTENSWDFSSVELPIEDRGRLYSSLIAIAANLPSPKVPRAAANDDRPRRSPSLAHLKTPIKEGTRNALRNLLSTPIDVRCYVILWGIIEKDDNFMTLILAQHLQFKNYPVPYFEDCDQELVKNISGLWLSASFGNPFGVENYYKHVVCKPIVDKLSKGEGRKKASEDVSATAGGCWTDATAGGCSTDATAGGCLTDATAEGCSTDATAGRCLTEEEGTNYMDARKLLCKALLERGAKDGARFLQMLLFNRHDYCKLEDLVKEIFSRPRDQQFKKHFLKISDSHWSKLCETFSHGDMVKDGEGYSIHVGIQSFQMDYNLLCWAACRGYVQLVWLVEHIYTPPKVCDEYYYVNHVSKVSEAWKGALWCATRHGHIDVIHELLKLDWITENVDFNDYPWGWLPPLHLVALLGDVVLLRHLRRIHLGKAEHDSKECASNGAHKKDYKGKIPLDYAMAFTQNTTQKMHKEGHKDVVKKLLLAQGVGDRLQELYQIYIDQANTILIGAALIASVAFIGWLQPPLGYQDEYMAIKENIFIQIFIVFNALSFFLALATMFMGVVTTLFVHDKHERTESLIDMRRSSKVLIWFFLASMISISGAFISAGAAVLPPIHYRFKATMIASLSVGGLICFLLVLKISWSIAERQPGERQPSRREPPLHEEKQNDTLLENHTEDYCRKKFNEWDTDGDGYITKAELLNIKWTDPPHMPHADNTWQEEEVTDIMSRADKNDDRMIDFDEFKKIFMLPM